MSFHLFFRSLEIVSSSSIAITLTTLFLSKRSVQKKYVFLVALIAISFLVEVINFVLVLNQINNLYVLRIYTVIEVVLICLFYYKFYKEYFNSLVFIIPIPLFFLIAFWDYKINGTKGFDNYATAYEAIIFSIIALWSFYYVMKHMLFDNIIKAPFFWFNVAVLLYFGGNFILFVFDNYLLLHSETKSDLALWCIHSVLNIIYNIVLAIGFWKTRDQ